MPIVWINDILRRLQLNEAKDASATPHEPAPATETDVGQCHVYDYRRNATDDRTRSITYRHDWACWTATLDGEERIIQNIRTCGPTITGSPATLATYASLEHPCRPEQWMPAALAAFEALKAEQKPRE